MKRYFASGCYDEHSVCIWQLLHADAVLYHTLLDFIIVIIIISIPVLTSLR